MNGTAKKILTGVAMLLLTAAVVAAAGHISNGETHETPEQRNNRVKTIINESPRLQRIENKLDRLLERPR